MISIGLMSGTSMDGLDICLSDIHINENDDIEYNIIDFMTFSYPQKIKNNIISIINGDDSKIKETDNDLGRFFLEKTILFLNNKEIELISSHGQTISHENKKYSRQIGNPEFLRNYYNVPVYYNFRIDDILNNGTGAPLVPYLDWVLFKNSNVDILAINIGGISNLTYIPRNSSKNMVKGFDMGPGMCLIDLFVRNEWNENFDYHGELSSKGKINKKLLNRAINIISDITGKDSDQSKVLLSKSNGNVKSAIIMSVLKVSQSESLKLINKYHGNIRSILRNEVK